MLLNLYPALPASELFVWWEHDGAAKEPFADFEWTAEMYYLICWRFLHNGEEVIVFVPVYVRQNGWGAKCKV